MKIFTGIVTARKMAKTATVMVERTVIHAKYLKRFKATRKYHVHDETDAKVGDTIKFVTCKPYSKLVKWEMIKERISKK